MYIKMLIYTVAVLLSGLILGSGFSSERENVIYLTTMGNISDENAPLVKEEIEKFYGMNVFYLGKNELPASAWCSLRKRYVAVEILKSLQKKTINGNYKVLALTDKDIEIEKNNHWGVMGLAYLGGNECVVSTYRIGGKKDRLIKVALHETGHMLGISHCTSGIASCLMKDANGKGATVDKARKYVCKNCKSKIKT